MMNTRADRKASRQVRCVIYTRKSTAEGLDQEFNTLDAQREAAESYIASQRQQGWICLPDRYDDGGYTGGNMERPAMKQLLADIEDGKVDCVVVYKVDRLSRSLLDFARIMEVFEQHNVSFVSITQQFNTATSMGRLILNVLLSFAQFEREMIAERTRDKMAAARRKGKWLGGTPVLGYDVDPQTRRLIVNPEEAARVRDIFWALPRAWWADSDGPGTIPSRLGQQALDYPQRHRFSMSDSGGQRPSGARVCGEGGNGVRQDGA
jgi:site-specific DNA recombinase